MIDFKIYVLQSAWVPLPSIIISTGTAMKSAVKEQSNKEEKVVTGSNKVLVFKSEEELHLAQVLSCGRSWIGEPKERGSRWLEDHLAPRTSKFPNKQSLNTRRKRTDHYKRLSILLLRTKPIHQIPTIPFSLPLIVE